MYVKYKEPSVSSSKKTRRRQQDFHFASAYDYGVGQCSKHTNQIPRWAQKACIPLVLYTVFASDCYCMSPRNSTNSIIQTILSVNIRNF